MRPQTARPNRQVRVDAARSIRLLDVVGDQTPQHLWIRFDTRCELRALRHEFPGVVHWRLAVLSAKENHVAQCGQMDHTCTFARWRRLRRKHLFPIATRRKPSPCSVLVYATASA